MPRGAPNLNWYQRFTYTVVNSSEHFFYVLGCQIGTHPKRTIICCWALVILSSLGFLRFHQEKNPMKLWVPPDSEFVHDTEWLISKFQTGFRVQVLLITAEDVLTPEVLQKLLDIEERVRHLETANNVTWPEVCFNIPKVDRRLISMLEGRKHNENDKDASATLNAALYCSFVESIKNECFQKSILELWDYDRTKISGLTKEDIIETINSYDRNAILGRLKDFHDLLGGVTKNESGYIIAAEALQNYWMVNVNFTAVDMDKSGNIAGTADWATENTLEWETEFTNVMEGFAQKKHNFSLYYTASRNFGDISSKAMFQDIGILCIGIVIMVIYVQLVISKFNWLEARVALANFGLLSVGMSFIVGCSLCSLFGVSYGPVHTSLPFLLMGLGVDDMFVIMACWDDLSKEQKKLPVPERIGLILKHGGVSITVTSVTDILAFIIGSSTILPSLQSYCIYAAVCVLMTFVFAITFFTACFVLDQDRVENKKNGIIVCYQHSSDYEPNRCSQRQTSNRVFEFIYRNFILTTVGKIVVITITIACLALSLQSIVKLEKMFDPSWFVPKTSHLSKYLDARKEYYPTHGFEAGLYMGGLNYTHEFVSIKAMVEKLESQNHIATDVVSWVKPFRNYVKTNFGTDIYEEVLSDEYFNLYLSMFLFSARNAKYQANFHFESKLECGVPAPKIIISNIDFRFHYFRGPKEHLPAMHVVQDLVKKANFTTGDRFATAWSKVFATWVTDEVIDIEVIRNLQLALLCVMSCTILLIADIQTCFWIFVCVLLTMVNVMGFMQRWGLTIDLVSCIGLELAIGLCVDYATHIGHTFLTVRTGNRTERALKTVTSIGSAVLYGGLSTLIGVFMLSQSEAYVFQSFFKIFLLVVLFGLFHGVVLLPVIFSWIGPKPYNMKIGGTIPESETVEFNTKADEVKDKEGILQEGDDAS